MKEKVQVLMERIIRTKPFKFTLSDLMKMKCRQCVRSGKGYKERVLKQGFSQIQKELDIITYLKKMRLTSSLASVTFS